MIYRSIALTLTLAVILAEMLLDTITPRPVPSFADDRLVFFIAEWTSSLGIFGTLFAVGMIGDKQ